MPGSLETLVHRLVSSCTARAIHSSQRDGHPTRSPLGSIARNHSCTESGILGTTSKSYHVFCGTSAAMICSLCHSYSTLPYPCVLLASHTYSGRLCIRGDCACLVAAHGRRTDVGSPRGLARLHQACAMTLQWVPPLALGTHEHAHACALLLLGPP